MARSTIERKIDRLFWRAGFGPTPEVRRRYVQRGLDAAVNDLLHPPTKRVLVGPAPRAENDSDHLVALRPLDLWGHDVLWWLDRMVRTRAPLVERMTLNLHDHFATTNADVGDVKLMLKQNATLRKHALGNFGKLAHAMLDDRAMQWFLSLVYSSKSAPNENFARELMELFTIGSGYTEQDIRQAARALTGYWYDYDRKRWYWNAEEHDDGVKRVFGKRGRFGPHDIVDLCLAHPAHARFICTKLWSYFSPVKPPRSTLNAMVRAYTGSGRELRPVLHVILTSRAFYANLDQPDLVKPPVVFLAGAMRQTRTFVKSRAWSWLLEGMGQVPFYPPNVGGWNQNESFLSTMSLQSRSSAITYIVQAHEFDDEDVPADEKPDAALAWALKATGYPKIRTETHAELRRIARAYVRRGDWDRHTAAARRRILRHLLLAGPDAQVH